jgi:hypothetical protein
MPKGYWFLLPSTISNEGIAVGADANIAPIQKPKFEGIFLKLLVVNSRKVPIFADPIQKRIPITIHHHGKSL